MEHITNFDERYELIEELGSGSYAVVYKIKDRITDEYFAAKMYTYPDDISENGDIILSNFIGPDIVLKDSANASFIRELAIYAELNKDPKSHSLFPRCYGYTTDRYRLIIELYDSSMYEKSFKYDELINVYKQLLQSLDNLHSHGIVHRDIKPMNMLWSESERRAVISDLGSSKLLSTLPVPNQATAVVSTLPFFSPEILNAIVTDNQSEWKYSHAMDVYALAVSFVYIAGGEWAESIGLDYDYLLDFLNSIYKKGDYTDLNFETLNEYLTKQISKRYNLEETKNILGLLIPMLEWEPEQRISAKDALNMDIFNDQFDLLDQVCLSYYSSKPIDTLKLDKLQKMRYTPYLSQIRNKQLTKVRNYVYPDVISRSPQINYKIYSILTRWLNDVANKFKLYEETLYTGLIILDDYMSKKTITLNKLQLYGCVCQYLSSFYHEMYTIPLDDYEKICAHAYTMDEFKSCLYEVMNTIDVNVWIHVPFNKVIKEFADEWDLSMEKKIEFFFLTKDILMDSRQYITGVSQHELARMIFNKVRRVKHAPLNEDINRQLNMALKKYTDAQEKLKNPDK